MPSFSRYRCYSESDYPGLREVLAPPYRNLPAENIEALFESYDLSAEDIEGFFDFLKDAGKAIVGVAPSILPVAGTVLGTAFGGPAGAALGGTLGKLAGGAISKATAPRPSSAPRAAPGPQTPQPPPGASPAAGQLMQTMFRPETLQALMSMLMGQLGRSNVKVGSTPVPVGAFTNLLGVLANQAQAEYNSANPGARVGIPEYLIDFAGEAIGDLAVAEHRANALLEMLQESDEESSTAVVRMRPTAYLGISPVEEEAFYAQLEAAEFYIETDEW